MSGFYLLRLQSKQGRGYAEDEFSKPGEYDISITSKKGSCTAFSSKRNSDSVRENIKNHSTDAMKNFDLNLS
jgi:hypothetical protein